MSPFVFWYHFCQKFFQTDRVRQFLRAEKRDSGSAHSPCTLLPRSKLTRRLRLKSSGNRWNLEAVCRAGKTSNFSGIFWPNSCSFWWKTAGSRRKNSKIFRPRILLPIPIDFRSFFVGNGDFFWPFWSVPIVSGDRNPRSGLYSACTSLYSAYTPFVLRSTGVSLFPLGQFCFNTAISSDAASLEISNRTFRMSIDFFHFC